MTTKPAAKKTRKKPAPAASFVPPRIGRPPTGSAMPAKVRQAKFLEDLRQHGGDKIGVSLSPESIVHLHEIAEAQGFTGRGKIKETVVFALAQTAMRRK